MNDDEASLTSVSAIAVRTRPIRTDRACCEAYARHSPRVIGRLRGAMWSPETSVMRIIIETVRFMPQSYIPFSTPTCDDAEIVITARDVSIF